MLRTLASRPRKPWDILKDLMQQSIYAHRDFQKQDTKSRQLGLSPDFYDRHAEREIAETFQEIDEAALLLKKI